MESVHRGAGGFTSGHVRPASDRIPSFLRQALREFNDHGSVCHGILKFLRMIAANEIRTMNRRLYVNVCVIWLVLEATINAGCAADGLRELDQMAERFEITIVHADPMFPVQTRHGAIQGKAASRDRVISYADMLVEEFSLYPKALIQRTRLRSIVLCDGLSFAGQRRNAVPDFEHDMLYLDVVRGKADEDYLRRVMHHEFFHIIDYRDDGLLYRDDSWAALNSKDFNYGAGGRNVQDMPSTSVLTSKYTGFLNHYSTTGVEEDKAEVFANLMVPTAKTRARFQDDSVLAQKAVAMKRVLRQFCPELNQEFWQRVEKYDRSESAVRIPAVPES